MAVSIGKLHVSPEDIYSRVSDIDILHYYFGANTIPCIISSPLRTDNHPSMGFYSLDGSRIYWTDFSTKERGSLFDLLGKYWGKNLDEVLSLIWEDLPSISRTMGRNVPLKSRIMTVGESEAMTDLQCTVREWRPHDIEYWNSFGISLEWLKYADIYPISHKIIIKGDRRMVFPADKYAYAYVEFKEGNVTLKIYQPFNCNGYKWSNKHDRSVISLWKKVPEFGDRICICSSMKDALCLWANTGIPALAIQGEGYGMSNTAITELKRRFKKIFILLDNDPPGIADGKKLAESTGFTNIILPEFQGGKDISDFYKTVSDKEKFKNVLLKLFGQH